MNDIRNINILLSFQSSLCYSKWCPRVPMHESSLAAQVCVSTVLSFASTALSLRSVCVRLTEWRERTLLLFSGWRPWVPSHCWPPRVSGHARQRNSASAHFSSGAPRRCAFASCRSPPSLTCGDLSIFGYYWSVSALCHCPTLAFLQLGTPPWWREERRSCADGCWHDTVWEPVGCDGAYCALLMLLCWTLCWIRTRSLQLM